MEVLFEVSEEDFNIPSCLVQPGNGSCGKFHIVGQQLYGEVVPDIVHGNSPYGYGVLFVCSVSLEYHYLINEYFRVSLVRQVTLFHALINQVVPDSDYKEHLCAVLKVQKTRVKVSTVAHNDAAGLHLHVPCRRIITRLSVCNMHIFRKKRTEVQWRVQFHCPF